MKTLYLFIYISLYYRVIILIIGMIFLLQSRSNKFLLSIWKGVSFFFFLSNPIPVQSMMYYIIGGSMLSTFLVWLFSGNISRNKNKREWIRESEKNTTTKKKRNYNNCNDEYFKDIYYMSCWVLQNVKVGPSIYR